MADKDDLIGDGVVKSAARVVEILELFEARQSALSINQIVEGLKLPQSSVSSLVKSLVILGYLNRIDDTRTFTPSERLAFLGHWTLGKPRGMEAVQVMMGELSETTGEAILLGCRSGTLLRYVSIIESPHVLRFTLNLNQTRPIQSCGMGIMLLTLLADSAVAPLVRRFNDEVPDHPLKRPESQVLEDVRRGRAQGYFETFGMVTQEVGTISTVLPLPAEGRVLGIGIGGPLSRLDKKRDWLRQTLMEKVAAFVAADGNS
ncbi:hypothetical protein LCGC14_1726480 [marine sediment metagenome]|uniref:HTH iclR-type domain-containing protein n=1 Tax=marine sediment metagenome TaxID=412755 RepID=A0A0F9HYK0_9ZZZZ|tara:strand:- start:1851 stop:2630 length:780 start_codon:yes stop_codon:yes gene_type:complete